ncbi:MAG: amidohydrolase family protein [Nocardioidaceae bacterium]
MHGPLEHVTLPLVDHHCHGLVRRDVDRPGFEGLLNEAPGASALGTSVFDSMLGLAVRRHCAPLLDLEPLVDPDSYLRRRTELGRDETSRRMLSAAGIADFIVDTGYVPEPITDPAALATLAGDARGHEIIRLEVVGQDLLAAGIRPVDFGEALRERLKASGAVGAKSIAAYRVGLALPGERPSDDELAAALTGVAADASGAFRIAHPVVNGYLAWTAIELGMPLQFHVGYGDSDVDLLDCDPLRLTPFLRATQDCGVPVLLLHNYPFHRNASYLAQVFDHVFMDVGLAVHNTGALSRALIAESLELVPFGKMLFSSDAFGLPELYLLGAMLFRQGLDEVLTSLVERGEMGRADADRIAGLICAENARRVYRLAG